MNAGPSPHVLDLFAAQGAVIPLAGGQGRSVRTGDLVLSPDRDPRVSDWLSPLLAGLAVRLDEQAGRARRDLRIAVPVPARDGSWVVDGWSACRYEPGSSPCQDLDVLVATGRLLHAQLAAAVPAPHPALNDREDRWAVADRLAFGPGDRAVAAAVDRAGTMLAELVEKLVSELSGSPTRPSQLVHGDLAGNVLLDAGGAPVVIDFAPYWRPARWAEAVCVLDAVLWQGAPPSAVAAWSGAGDRDAMIRAAVFRVLSDLTCDVEAYNRVLAGAILDPSS